MGIQDNGRYVMAFLFNDQRVVLKVTKYTTCDDVIEMILHKQGVSTSPSLFTMYERTGVTERAIPGRSLVVKVWRSWGCEGKNFHFVIKRKMTTPRRHGLQLKNLSQESYIDRMFVKKYKADNTRRVTLDCGQVQRHRTISYVGVSMAADTSRTNDNNTSLLTRSKSTPKNAKDSRFVLSKFFKDILKTRCRKQEKTSGNRKAGIGLETSMSDIGRHGDGTENPDVSLSSTLHARCQYVWDKYSISDSESDSDVADDNDTDDSSLNLSFIHLDETQDHTDKLNKAFVRTSHDIDNDEGIDVTSVASSNVDLDTAFVGDHELFKSISQDSMTDKYDDVSVSVNGFEMNITDDEYVRGLFGCHGDEDEEMDSFMRSRIESF